MIKVIPAIDLINGQCVRLSEGDFNRKKVYDNNPLDVAKRFEDAGIQYLHVVDLDAALQGKPVNLSVIETIATHTALKIDAGGGIKSDVAIQQVLSAGAQQITAGSIAVKAPELVQKWLHEYGSEVIMLGADVKNRTIAINGWTEQSSVQIMQFIDRYQAKGMRYCVCTDISKDGMLQGPSVNLYKDILDQFPDLQLVASGGVSSIQDIEILESIGCYAVIVGKAIYEQKITLDQLKKYHYAN